MRRRRAASRSWSRSRCALGGCKGSRGDAPRRRTRRRSPGTPARRRRRRARRLGADAAPPDDAIPATSSDELTARARHLLEAIAKDDADLAADILFPRDGWLATRDAADPGKDWEKHVAGPSARPARACAAPRGARPRSVRLARARARGRAGDAAAARLEEAPLDGARLAAHVRRRRPHAHRSSIREMTAWRGAWYVTPALRCLRARRWAEAVPAELAALVRAQRRSRRAAARRASCGRAPRRRRSGAPARAGARAGASLRGAACPRRDPAPRATLRRRSVVAALEQAHEHASRSAGRSVISTRVTMAPAAPGSCTSSASSDASSSRTPSATRRTRVSCSAVIVASVQVVAERSSPRSRGRSARRPPASRRHARPARGPSRTPPRRPTRRSRRRPRAAACPAPPTSAIETSKRARTRSRNLLHDAPLVLQRPRVRDVEREPKNADEHFAGLIRASA